MSKIVTFVLISIVIILGTYLFKKNGFNAPQLCCDPFLRVKIPFLLLNAPQLAAIGIFTYVLDKNIERENIKKYRKIAPNSSLKEQLSFHPILG